MNINTRFLETHFQTKIANHEWLTDCLEGKTEAFPFRPAENGNAIIGELFVPNLPSTSHVMPCEDNRPQFVVNIPFAHRPKAQDDYADLISKMELLKLEGCGTTNQLSPPLMKQQVATVIGINQIHSIDKTINGEFQQYIHNIPAIQGIVHRVFGFLWKPVWINQTDEPDIYPLSKAFLLLKALSSTQAEKVRTAYEMPAGLSPAIASQIPFQKLRETIKNSAATSEFVEYAKQHAPGAPIYYTVMDADFQALRVKTGIFSRLSDQVAAHNNPSIVCLGYQVKQDELPLIRLGVKIDMAVRGAMASVFPYSAYFPEPCTAFIIKRPPNPSFLHNLTFIGRGRTLETRRFVESGLEKKYFDDNVVYAPDGGVTTTTPKRMITLKNQRFKTLTAAQIKQRQCLEALRGISQTHATPKQWADNLYNGLTFTSSRVTDATAPMMYIFGIFDPLSRMFSAPRFSKAVFEQTMRDYDNPLSEDAQAVLDAARATLWSMKMEKSMIDKIEEAAKRSGKAIRDTLFQ
jgi:hypothetical protein